MGEAGKFNHSNEEMVVDVIGHLEPFKHNSLRATLLTQDHGVLVGSLPDRYVDDFIQSIKDAAERGFALYVLYSYHTPVAWISTEEGQPYYMPAAYYSYTSAYHQELIQRAFEAAAIRKAADDESV